MDATEHAKFHASQWEARDERLHRIEETMTNELGLSKYRCPCFIVVGARGLY
jgi:hypothetical protein